MKKRNVKYNPNKLTQKRSAGAHRIHKLEMSYDNDLLDQVTNEWKAKQNATSVPLSVITPHITGDLCIAIHMRLIDLVQKWNVVMTYFLRNPSTGQTDEVEMGFKLPIANIHDVLSNESSIEIERDSGFFTPWQGLNKEIEDALKPMENEGFVCEKTIAYISVETPFKSVNAYETFLWERKSKSIFSDKAKIDQKYMRSANANK